MKVSHLAFFFSCSRLLHGRKHTWNSVCWLTSVMMHVYLLSAILNLIEFLSSVNSYVESHLLQLDILSLKLSIWTVSYRSYTWSGVWMISSLVMCCWYFFLLVSSPPIPSKIVSAPIWMLVLCYHPFSVQAMHIISVWLEVSLYCIGIWFVN